MKAISTRGVPRIEQDVLNCLSRKASCSVWGRGSLIGCHFPDWSLQPAVFTGKKWKEHGVGDPLWTSNKVFHGCSKPLLSSLSFIITSSGHQRQARLRSQHCNIPRPTPFISECSPQRLRRGSVANTPTAATPPAITSKYLGSSPSLGWNWEWRKLSKRIEPKSGQAPAIKDIRVQGLADRKPSWLSDLSAPIVQRPWLSKYTMSEWMRSGIQCVSMTHDVQGLCKDTIKM